jgi:hypothetical protein
MNNISHCVAWHTGGSQQISAKSADFYSLHNNNIPLFISCCIYERNTTHNSLEIILPVAGAH